MEIPTATGLLGELLLLSAVVIASLRPLPAGILLLSIQSATLALISVLVNRGASATLAVAILVFGVKALLIPWFLLRLNRRTGPAKPPLFPGLWSWAVSGMLVLVLNPSRSLVQDVTVRHPHLLAVALDLVLLGLFTMIRRRLLLAQVVGMVVIENGLYAAGLAVVGGLPLVLDLGGLVDLILAVLILGWLFSRAHSLLPSPDIDDLSRLRG